MMATSWPCGILRSDSGVSEPYRNVVRRVVQHGRIIKLLMGLHLLAITAQAQNTVPGAASVAPASKAAVAPVQTVAMPAADSAGVVGQTRWKFVRLIKMRAPGAASLDRRGALYVADADNNLRQYSPEGLPLNTFAPAQPGHAAQVEAWNVTTVLVFNDDRQQLVLLDRFLALIAEVRLADFVDGMIRVATLAPDNRIWLLDESSLELREFDPNTLRLVKNTPLDLIIGRTRPDFRFLRHYQNNLYLVDKVTGVYVFDNLGNYKKKIPFVGLNTVGFRGDELYYFDEGALHFFHLYNLTERRVALPADVAPATVQQVLLGESYAYIFTSAGVAVYQAQ